MRLLHSEFLFLTRAVEGIGGKVGHGSPTLYKASGTANGLTDHLQPPTWSASKG